MEILKRLFNQEKDQRKTDDLQQKEKEAIIDLLMLAIFADNHLSLAEDKIMNEAIDKYSWDSPTGISIYLSQATSRARNALSSPDNESEYLDFVAERLSSRTVKNSALDLLSKVFYADGTTEKEKLFTDKVKKHFGL